MSQNIKTKQKTENKMSKEMSSFLLKKFGEKKQYEIRDDI